MNNIINTQDLNVHDLPRKHAKRSKIVDFASTFDLDKEINNGINISGLSDINDLSSVLEIRAALYAEWRRYHHRGYGPEQELEIKAWAAIELLRNKLHSHV